jgi:hypothetical protein
MCCTCRIILKKKERLKMKNLLPSIVHTMGMFYNKFVNKTVTGKLKSNFVFYVLRSGNSRLLREECADFMSENYIFQVPLFIHIEYNDRHFIFTAHGECSEVHDGKTFLVGFIKA